jgi:hypothetical protein
MIDLNYQQQREMRVCVGWPLLVVEVFMSSSLVVVVVVVVVVVE